MPSMFPDLRDFYDPSLTLPVGGTEYRIPAPSQAQTLAIREVLAGMKVTDAEYLDRIMALLGASRGDDGLYAGGILDKLTSGGLSWAEQVRVAETAALYYADSEERGRSWWAAELHAEAVAVAAAEAIDKAEAAAPVKPAAPRKTPARRAPRKTG